MRFWISLYTLKLPVFLVYMLQQVEYDHGKFNQWFGRLIAQSTPIYTVMKRKRLVLTSRARMLLVIAYGFTAGMLGSGIFFVLNHERSPWLLVADIVFLPFEVFIVLGFIVFLADHIIVRPKNKRLIAHSRQIFHDTPATKIAIVGSYGKTTMKELLEVVLSEGLKVAVTPGNKNVPISHALFARRLNGDEQVIVIEFGEGEPGDVASMTDTVAPDYAIITGLAPNHLDQYPSLDALASDVLSVSLQIDRSKCLLNHDSPMLIKYADKNSLFYSKAGVMGWHVDDIQIGIDGVAFTMQRDGTTMRLKSALLGRHQVGPLACVAAVAHELGLTPAQIKSGIAKTVPYEHRMQPRLLSGAWIIDDTYNGNLEGLLAGLDLLSELKAKRKWYVTPGLVDQGVETAAVHQKLGEKISATAPDIVVLMENSVRPIIQEALQKNGYHGEVRIEQDPLHFYTNLEHQVATGDMVLMQNDWTDNYN